MIAHVQIAGLFVAVERAARPELTDRPVLIGGPVGRRGNVAVASSEAQALGVRTGMCMREALALMPGAVCLPGSIERYLEASAQLDERLRATGCPVEWTALDEAWLDLGPLDTARTRLDQARAALARDFALDAAIGVGATRAVAGVAARLMSPSGLLIVLPGYEARMLAPLGVARLPGLSDDDLARLRADGLETLGDLAHADEARLVALVGRGGTVLSRHALGLDDRDVAGSVPRGIARTVVLGACGASQAPGMIARLADDAAAGLRRSGHAARQVRLRVRDRAGERLRTHAFAAAIDDAAAIADAVDALARRLLHPARDLYEAAVFLSALTPVDAELPLFPVAGLARARRAS